MYIFPRANVITLILIASFLLLLNSPGCIGKVIRVPKDEGTIQAGINAAANGDIVLVAPGAYFETIDFLGKAITVQGENGAEEVIIDAGGMGPVVTFASGEGRKSIFKGFTIRNGVAGVGGGILCDNASPTIKYNKITGNQAFDSGGGIGCIGKASPIILSNSITYNTAAHGGGVSGGWDSRLLFVLKDNAITENIATYGGGIYYQPLNEIAYVKVVNNTISRNTSTDRGGGLWFCGGGLICGNKIEENNAAGDGGGMYGSGALVKENLFRGNSASDGGAIQVWDLILSGNHIVDNTAVYTGGGVRSDGGVTMVNNRIHGNHAGSIAGGVFVFEWVWPFPPEPEPCPYGITNNTIYSNSDGQGCAGVLFDTASCIPQFANNIVASNEGGGVCASLSGTPECWHNNVWDNLGGNYLGFPDPTGIDGNISADPLFSDAHLHIADGSPCIDAGTNNAKTLPYTDFEGDSRVIDGNDDGMALVDIGADEYTPYDRAGSGLES